MLKYNPRLGKMTELKIRKTSSFASDWRFLIKTCMDFVDSTVISCVVFLGIRLCKKIIRFLCFKFFILHLSYVIRLYLYKSALTFILLKINSKIIVFTQPFNIVLCFYACIIFITTLTKSSLNVKETKNRYRS